MKKLLKLSVPRFPFLWKGVEIAYTSWIFKKFEYKVIQMEQVHRRASSLHAVIWPLLLVGEQY